MNYIYDIILNFNKLYYNFFEWDKRDAITNIKKIPIFKVNNKIFNILKYHDSTIDNSFINKIKGKTLTYSKIEPDFAFLASNGKEVVGLLLNNKGHVIKKSSLLLDEEEEVLDECYNLEETNIKIIKYSKNRIPTVNRCKKEKKEYLIKYINKENNLVNLKYLYYDYYEKEENNINVIKNNLINEINNNWNNKLDSLYNTIIMLKKIAH